MTLGLCFHFPLCVAWAPHLSCRRCCSTQAEVGIDAGLFARQLMAHSKGISEEMTASSYPAYKALCERGSDSSPTDNETGLQQTILEKAASLTSVKGEVQGAFYSRGTCSCFGGGSGPFVTLEAWESLPHILLRKLDTQQQ